MKLIRYRADMEYWQTEFRINGKRIRRKLPFTKKSQQAEARAFSKEIYMQMLRGELLDECKTTFKKMTEIYLAESNLRGIESKLYRLNYIYKFIGDKYLDQITWQDYEAIKNYLKKERRVKNQSVNRYLQDVQAVMNFAKRRRIIKDFPPIYKLKDEPQRKKRALTKEETDAIYNSLPEYLKAPFEFGLSTGWRKANIVGLKRKHLTDIGDGLYKVNFAAEEMKAGTPFEHICTRRESEILRKCISIEHQLIFRRETKVNGAKSVGLGDFKKSIISSRKKVGFYWTWHELRHTRATEYMKQGIAEATLNQLMAWSPKSRMAGQYAHLRDEKFIGNLRERLTDVGHVLGTEQKNI